MPFIIWCHWWVLMASDNMCKADIAYYKIVTVGCDHRIPYTYKGFKFRSFHSQLVIRKVSSSKFHWLASIEDSYMWTTFKDNTLPALAAEVVSIGSRVVWSYPQRGAYGLDIMHQWEPQGLLTLEANCAFEFILHWPIAGSRSNFDTLNVVLLTDHGLEKCVIPSTMLVTYVIRLIRNAMEINLWK